MAYVDLHIHSNKSDDAEFSIREIIEMCAEKIYKFKKYTGIPLDEKQIYDKSEGKIISGELIAEVVLSKEDAQKYQILKPYLKGGSRSDRTYVNFYWDFFAQGKLAYIKI
jgi:hypothetical protein